MGRTKNEEVWSCLTVRQPYAWAIIVGAKDVETRSRRSNYLGRLYIHAAAARNEKVDAVDKVTEQVAAHLGIPVAAARTRYRRHRERGLGAIIGRVRMVGCAVSYDSEWFEGEYGYLLCDPVRLRQPIPAKGSTAIPFKFRP